MKKKRETSISRECADVLDAMNLYHLRLQSGRVKVRGGFMHLCPTGTPDRLFLLPVPNTHPMIVFVEVKVPGEELRPEQVIVHARLVGTGACVLTVTSGRELNLAILEMKKGLIAPSRK